VEGKKAKSSELLTSLEMGGNEATAGSPKRFHDGFPEL
jgi:hypothetical protein